MIDPINTAPYPHQQGYWAPPEAAEGPSKKDLHAAEEEVASLYYVTSLQSLAASQDQPEKRTAAVATEQKSVEKSFLSRAKDWFWGLFGWGQKQPATGLDPAAGLDLDEGNEVNSIGVDDSHAGGAPQLQHPEANDHKRISQAIAKLNRELVNRLKDIAEFEEEMRKSSSSKLDKLIFLHLVNSSIAQKKLKESNSLISHDQIMSLHKKNQEMQKTYFDLIDTIQSENRVRGVLKWINIGLTAMTVGGTAVAFAVSGPLGIFAVGLPLSYLGKGITTLTDGILKYQSDRKTGELFVVKQDRKANASDKQEEMAKMQDEDSTIAALLKQIRHNLENHSKAARASFGRNS